MLDYYLELYAYLFWEPWIFLRTFEVFILLSLQVLGNEERRREYDRGILNPLDERSGHAASRSQHEFTEDDILRYQEIFNQHHDMPKSKRSQFVQRGKKKGVYDFDEYYKQHYQDEMKKQLSDWA